eukprot:3298103-Rhodomonas_salina.1
MSAAEVETSVSEHHNPSPRERLMTMVMMGAGVGADADAPRASQSLLPARRLRANCEPRTHSDSIHETRPALSKDGENRQRDIQIEEEGHWQGGSAVPVPKFTCSVSGVRVSASEGCNLWSSEEKVEGSLALQPASADSEPGSQAVFRIRDSDAVS